MFDDCDLETNEGWENALQHFKDEHFPVFASFGIDFSTAYNIWTQNRLWNVVDDLLTEIRDKKEWKE